ncbi:MAG: YihY/virulence factor BrkB family protein [Actinobacteria bacterium]|nr:MAG: YihY/virulence factor BrkB family protein [Actinomycetota bacterium]
MSTAHLVPETRDLSGDDAFETLRRTGRRHLMADAFRRLRVSDGFSHARSLAYLSILIVVQGTIALVGLATALNNEGFSDVVTAAIEGSAPGPSGELLTAAAHQARTAGGDHNLLALFLGLAGCLFAGTTALGQFERALNRLYGVETDRPTAQKYGFAFILAVAIGTCLTAAFATVAVGDTYSVSLDGGALDTAWSLVRWPLAALLVTAGMAVLFRWSPRRQQPHWSWLTFGATVGVLLWLASTALLALFFRWSSTFGETYGPLAGLVALLIWALLSTIALLYGAALNAQLEAVRAQTSTPQDQTKVADSEPEAVAPVTEPVLVASR